MGIISGRTPAVNRGYDQRKVEEARNFSNKLWNIARYIEGILGDETERSKAEPKTAADHWVLTRLQRFQEKLQADMDEYRFSEAYESLYHFVWDDFADWYIEASKAEPNKPLLAYTLEQILLLAHPFAPFVTETIWQTLAWEKDSILAGRIFSKINAGKKERAEEFEEIKAIVAEARYITKALAVAGATLYYTDVPFLETNAEVIKRLARLRDVSEVKDGDGLYLTSTRHRCWLDIDTATAKAYLGELEGKRSKQGTVISQLEGRLKNDNYVKNAPKRVVDQTKEQLEDAREQLESINKEIERFSD
jgi:valyl-tRNA synthetase